MMIDRMSIIFTFTLAIELMALSSPALANISSPKSSSATSISASSTVVSASSIPKVSEANAGALSAVEISDLELQKKIILDSKRTISDRWQAVMKVASQYKGTSKDFIVSLSDRSEWFLRNASLVALQAHYPDAVKANALKLLKDKALVVRSAAVDVLMQQSQQQELSLTERSTLWSELEAPYNFRGTQSLWVRSQIAELLAKSPLKNENSMFAKYLNQSNIELKNIAQAALKKIQ